MGDKVRPWTVNELLQFITEELASGAITAESEVLIEDAFGLMKCAVWVADGTLVLG